MFGGEIATAFVRIRPNMTGFQSETESGVKGAFSKVAKIVGAAFGARAAYEIAKSSIDAAALIQKQVETVRAEFGQAGKSLIDFANQAGTSLGAVNTDTLGASARFGILFKNLRIGPALAAQMTKGFEKLALATNAIKGGSSSDAAQLLNILSKGAATGRGLNQLGIIVSSAQEQIAAFKLGLIQTTTQALTPAQKAIAIYAIATRNLGSVMRQARAHSHDFADVQSTLTAEWAKAKEALGAALLPEVKKLVSEFSNWLAKLEKSGRLQRIFNEAGRIAAEVIHAIASAVKIAKGAWDLLSHAIGGAKGVAIAFFTVMAVNKIRQLASTIIGTLVRNAFVQLQVATEAEQAAYLEAFGTMEIATIGLAATIKTALISTGIGALVVAVGIMAAEIVMHFKTIKRWLGEFAHWIWSHWWVVSFLPVVGQMIWLVGEIIKHWNGVKAFFLDIAHFFRDVWTHPIRAVKELFSGLWKLIKSGLVATVNFFVDRLNDIINAYNAVAGWLTGNIPAIHHIGVETGSAYGSGFNKAAKDSIMGPFSVIGGIAKAIEGVAKDAGKRIAKKVNDGVTEASTAAVRTMTAAMRSTIDAAHKAIQSAIDGAKNNLVKIGDDLAKTIDQIQAKIGGAAGAIAGSPQGQAFAKLKKLIESGAPDFKIQRAQQELSSQLQNVGKAQQSLVKTQLDNLTAAFNKNKISYSTFESRLHEILHKNGITLKEALKAGGPAFADTFKAQVAALGEQAKQIADLPAKYRRQGGAGGAADIKIIRPLEVIRNENAKIAAAAAKQREAMLKEQAKTNLILDSTKQVIKRLPHSAPGFGKQPKGKGSHDARKGAKVGNRG